MTGPPVGPDTVARPAPNRVRQAELAISLVLRIGVGLAITLVVAGLVVVFARQGRHAPLPQGGSFRAFTRMRTPFPHSVPALVHALAHGDGRGIIELGLVVLILTPVARVAAGVVTFLYEGDRKMALVTVFVLVVLVGSFVVGGAS